MPVHCHPRFPSRNRRFPDRCRSPDCASTAFHCRCLLLRQKLFVLPCRRLRNNYILCPTGTPTFAAVRRQRRDLIIANASSAPAPTLAPHQRQRRKRYKRSPEPTTSPAAPIPRDQHRPICTCPPRAKGSLNRRSKWFSLVTFFLQKRKLLVPGHETPHPAPAGATPARRRGSAPRASAFFVSDGPISSNSGRNGGKNAGRNCVSALPQRAIPDSDFLRILAGIAFCHRCRIKGLCLRSPARRLTRPLASATAGVFRSYRRTSQAFPLRASRR